MKTKQQLCLAAVLAVLTPAIALTVAPSPATACYSSPSDIVKMTVRGHFWSLAKGNLKSLAFSWPDKTTAELEAMLETAPAADHRTLVRNIRITKRGATALVEIRVGGHSDHFRVRLTGAKYDFKMASVRRATRRERLTAERMARREARDLRRHRAAALQARARR